MHGGDTSFSIDEERGGQRVDTAVHAGRLIVANDYPVVDAEFGEEGLDHFPAFIVHGDTEDGKAFVLVLPLHLHEPGDLQFARSAPRREEVEQDHLALVIGQVNGLAVGVFEGELRRRFAVRIGFDACGPDGG